MSQIPQRVPDSWRVAPPMEYRIMRHWTVEDMEREVNAALADGWALHGPTGVHPSESVFDGSPGTAYTQTMVRTTYPPGPSTLK